MNNEKIDDFIEQITKLFENQKSGYKIEGDGISLDPSSPLGKIYNPFELPFGKTIIFIHKPLNKMNIQLKIKIIIWKLILKIKGKLLKKIFIMFINNFLKKK